MNRLKLDTDTLQLSSLLERITGAQVKDCFKDNDGVIYCIVGTGQFGKAVGKGGAHIKRVQQEIQKKVKVIEYRDNLVDFVKNIIFPISVDEIVEEGEFVFIKDGSRSKKSILIGREGRNLELINRAVRRFFNKEVKVV